MKDNIATARLSTTLGSKICRSWQAGFNATAVQKLLDAGAILVGKNTHEFALGATNINAHYGDVHNPWDTNSHRGGFERGSAAAVAGGEVFASFGSDLGGSIRVPASLCGVVGLKPTHGRISLHGLIGAASSIDHLGPIARSVYDAALLYEVVAGFDSKDPHSSSRRVGDVVARLDDDIVGLRVGVIQDGSMGPVDHEIAQSLSVVAEGLAAAGCMVDEASLDGLNDSPLVTAVIAYSEVGAQQRTWIRARADDYGEDTRPLVQRGQLFSAGQYLEAQRARNEYRRRIEVAMGSFDVLVTPTAPIRAPRLDGVPDADSRQDPDPHLTLMRLAVPFSLTGLPAVSVPAAIDSRGLPIGVQFVARPYQESTLLRTARAYERVSGWAPKWPVGGIDQGPPVSIGAN